MANEDEDRKASWSSWFAPGDVRQAPKQDTDVDRSTPAATPSQPQATSKRESNPLIYFKHFVDDAFSAVTNFNKEFKDAQEAVEVEFDEKYKRWTGAENTRHLIQIQGAWVKATRAHCEIMGRPSEEAKARARLLLLESARRNSHVNPSKITALYEDPASIPGYGDDYPRWLSVEWFKSSEDSPINLEANPALAKYETKWRHAFEDLLEAALDKPMSSRERVGYRGLIGPTSTWRGPGLDWMLSLQCRGILPPQLPTMYSNASVAYEVFAKRGLAFTMLERWCQQNSPTSKSNHWEELRMDVEYNELLRAIDTPAPDNTTFVYDKLEALGIPFQPGTCGDAIGANKNESLLRQQMTQHAAPQEATSTGGCPDDLGRAVSEAVKSSYEPDTELDVYEQMYNNWVQDSTHQTSEGDYFEQEQQESHSSGARCPDGLGRAVGDAARQEAARAFADEENGLIDCYAGAVAAGAPDSNRNELEDYQMQLMLLDQQNKERLALARGGEESGLTDREEIMVRVQQRRNEREQIQQELDAARAVNDEENALVEEERSRIERWYEYRLQNLGVPSSFAQCPDELGRAIGDAATALESGHSGDVQPGIVLGAGAVATGTPDGPHGGNYALRTRQLDSKPDSLRDAERTIERRETLHRDQDSVNNVHEFYIRELAEQLQALRDDYDELADELAEARDQSEQNSRMLEQNDHQASLAHLHKPASVQADTNRPQVLSTLTTTETTRLPDGSVKTTVVLKRRFAGGFEETQESTQTSFEEPTAPTSAQEPSKKGWFWS
ncbi:hypothetical protein Q7P35_004690 [Cladosporium inversicolor]